MPGFSLFRIATICAILMAFIFVASAHADQPFPDLDEDGLSNELETTGWYNLAGGPFVTDYLKADSDDDGLTDGEEKLYNTNPLDYTNPGIYVKYESAFLTKQYFSVTDPAYLSMKQAGDRYLLTEAVVVRRGTTFHIGGPVGATLTIQPLALPDNGNGIQPNNNLTSLTPVADLCRGGWNVTIASNNTVGTYTATVSRGSWSKSIPLYVIFELPVDLTPTQIAAYIYDDDPANKRDEVSVWWRTPEWSYYYPGYSGTTPPTCSDYPNSPCSQWQYHLAQGYAQAFWTEHFKKNVFVDHAMHAIQGQTSQANATNTIADWADHEFRVVYQNTHNSWSTALYKWNDGTGLTMNGGACQDNANVFTTILRSSGIPARTFLKDYNKTQPNVAHGEGGTSSIYEYDHSVLIWLNGEWRAARSYTGEEKNDKYYPWPGSSSPGYVPQRALYAFPGYTDAVADLIVTSNENWDWQDGNNGGGMVNTTWTTNEGIPSAEFNYPNNNWDYQWWSNRPLQIERTPYMDILNYETWHGDNWAPSEWQNPPNSNPSGRNAQLTYVLPTGMPNPSEPLENWPYNPKPTACSPSTPVAVCQAFLAGQGMLQQPLTSLETPPAYNMLAATAVSQTFAVVQQGPIQLGQIVGDAGQDLNANGRFDRLAVQVEITTTQAGSYQLGGWLRVGEQLVAADTKPVTLTTGQQTVSVYFDGQKIGDAHVNGPYRLVDLWIAPADLPIEKEGVPDEALASKPFNYPTRPYTANQFEATAAYLADKFGHEAFDTDSDGYADSLRVDINLNVIIPQTFRVQGDLYDGQGNYIGHADWSGAGSTASLQFNIAKTTPPYTLQQLILFDAKGAPLDSRYYKAYEITDLTGQVDQGPVAIGGAPADGGIGALDVTATQAFTTTVVDTNGNGRYDQLVVTVGVQVTQQNGNYRIEGLLVNDAGEPVAWAVSATQPLTVGNRQMQLIFDGRVIHDHMAFSPATQTFKLVDVKIFSGNLSPATLEDIVPVAITTPAYTRNQFETTSLGLFEDNMERGSITTNNWTAQPAWSLSTNAAHSPTHAWRAAGSSGLLTTIPITLSNYMRPGLRFDTCYQMTGSDTGYVEISTNGSTWTRVATYTNSARPWSAQFVDLTSFAGSAKAWLRFNGTSPDSWQVDDVYLNAWPPETYASLNYTPQPVLVGANTTFIASYGFITPTAQITFTWNFGDGTPIQVTHVASITHLYAQALNYTTRLTVENGYNQAVDAQTVEAYATLNTNRLGNGSVFRNPDQTTYRAGDVVAVTAVTDPGWRFIGWSGDLTGTVNPGFITISGNKSVTATFTPTMYSLAINTVGNGSATKTPNQAAYIYGTAVTLTAIISPGWTFAGWSGDLSGSANPTSITMTTDITVTAVFTQNEYTLVTFVSPSSGGNVTKTPNQPVYHYGDVVTLTAAAATGWSFSTWSGDVITGTNPVTLTINGHKQVTANFTQNQYSLSSNIVGSGSITKTPNQSTYLYGAVVTLTAAANTGWGFSGWSGDLTGSASAITINSNKVVTATFSLLEYGLTVNVVGSGGNVTKMPDLSMYRYGDVVTLTANANTGWVFTGWSGGLSGSATPAALTMYSPKVVTATFTQIDYILKVGVVGGGSVISNPIQTHYHYGDTVNLTANANTGWTFAAWSGDMSGSANPTSIFIDASKTVTATFTPLGYTLSTEVSGGGSVTRNPDRTIYNYGDVVTLTATPDSADWSFANWSGDLGGSATPQTIVINGNKSVLATFNPNGYLLTLTTDGRGSIGKNPDLSVYHGEVVTLTAIPNAGWTFAGWSGDLTGTVTTKPITMDGDKTVTAAFQATPYLLVVHNTTGGNVTKNPSAPYYYGDVVTLTANINPGYAFASWNGDLVGSANPATITMTSDKHVTPTYTFLGYVLTTNTAGNGSVTRQPNLPNYITGTVATLTAAAASGWTFTGWSGALSGSVNPASLTMNGHKTVTATFTSAEYNLTVNTVGSGGVTKSPDQTAFHYGDMVTLTAAANSGWTFSSWSGALSGSVNPQSLTITGSQAVTATFTQDEYNLTINAVGGTVARSSNPPYHYDDGVTLTATANSGWTFAGWSGDLGGSANPDSLAMHGHKTVTAIFVQNEYNLTTNITGSGSVSKYPDQTSYHYGDVVTVTAVPVSGWEFVGWSGDLSGSELSKSLTMTGPRTVWATFSLGEYMLTVNVVGSGGSVTRRPNQSIYYYGDVVTLTAVTNPGWTFTGWSGDLSGSLITRSLTMTRSQVMTATFTQDTYPLTITVIGTGSVTKNPNQTTYHYGDIVALTAITTAPGWSFFLWDGDLSGSDNPQTITMNGPKNVIATFRAVERIHYVTINLIGHGDVLKEPDQWYYHYGDVITVTAVPDAGWSFAGWIGDLTGHTNPTVITIDNDKIITATFTVGQAENYSTYLPVILKNK